MSTFVPTASESTKGIKTIPYRSLIERVIIINNNDNKEIVAYISNVCVYTRRPQEIPIHHPPERVGPEEARKAGSPGVVAEQKLTASGGGMGEATEISPGR